MNKYQKNCLASFAFNNYAKCFAYISELEYGREPKFHFRLCFACTGTQAYGEYGRDDFSRTKNGNGADKGGPTLSKLGSNSTAQLYPKGDGEGRPAAMPPASVMTRLILIMVWRKLIRNPNTYSSLIGVIWSLVSYRSPNQCQFLIFSIMFHSLVIPAFVLSLM